MDAVDKVFYKDAEADDKLIGAYQMFDSVDGKTVLEDIMRFTSWGAQDPTVLDDSDAKSILAMQRVVWRIKGMLNSVPQTDKGEVDE
jgi:hypothetical protein